MPGESDDDVTPFVLYDTLRFSLHANGTISVNRGGEVDFGGVPDPTARPLNEPPEHELVQQAMGVDAIRTWLAHALGFKGPVWIALGALRERIVPDDRARLPGDFDIVLGNMDGTEPSFGQLALVETKVKRVRADGSDAKGSSNGTEQATGGAETGFDRVLLLHFVVGADRDDTPGASAASQTMSNADRRVALARTAGRLRHEMTRTPRPFGAAVIGWGRASGCDPVRSGAVIGPELVTPPPLRPLSDAAGIARRRDLLSAGFRAVLPSAAGNKFFVFCRKCCAPHGSPTFEPYSRCGCGARP